MRKRQFGNFGQASIGLPLVTSVIDTGIAAVTAYKGDKITQQIQSQQAVYATTGEYLQNLVSKLQSAGLNIVNKGIARPGTYDFEKALQQNLLSDMIYKGNCNADIYVPWAPGMAPGVPRQILGSFYSNGSTTSNTGTLSIDSGPTWATACKNAQDQFDIDYLKQYKNNIQFQTQRTQLSDLGNLSLLLKLGLGAFLLSLMMAALTTQQEVIERQLGL